MQKATYYCIPVIAPLLPCGGECMSKWPHDADIHDVSGAIAASGNIYTSFFQVVN